jgi:hypothetical protein
MGTSPQTITISANEAKKISFVSAKSDLNGVDDGGAWSRRLQQRKCPAPGIFSK